MCTHGRIWAPGSPGHCLGRGKFSRPIYTEKNVWPGAQPTLIPGSLGQLAQPPRPVPFRWLCVRYSRPGVWTEPVRRPSPNLTNPRRGRWPRPCPPAPPAVLVLPIQPAPSPLLLLRCLSSCMPASLQSSSITSVVGCYPVQQGSNPSELPARWPFSGGASFLSRLQQAGKSKGIVAYPISKPQFLFADATV